MDKSHKELISNFIDLFLLVIKSKNMLIIA